METIEWRDFERVEIRVGRVVSAEPFKEARVPAYILQVDFGESVGTRKSSARITANYRPRTWSAASSSAWSTSHPSRSAPSCRSA